MSGYWWECENCNSKVNFPQACGSKGIVHFIWDVLVPSHWDQSKLVLKCKKCPGTMRIAYEFPRKSKEFLRVVHIVGLTPEPNQEPFMQMMWETYPLSERHKRWFDFKYVIGRKSWGLNKPPVFEQPSLRKLLELYRQKTGNPNFP